MADKEMATFKVVLRTKDVEIFQGDDFDITEIGLAIFHGNKTIAVFAPGAWESITREKAV